MRTGRSARAEPAQQPAAQTYVVRASAGELTCTCHRNASRRNQCGGFNSTTRHRRLVECAWFHLLTQPCPGTPCTGTTRCRARCRCYGEPHLLDHPLTDETPEPQTCRPLVNKREATTMRTMRSGATTCDTRSAFFFSPALWRRAQWTERTKTGPRRASPGGQR